MENLPLLVPLVIFVPALGAFINFFFGAKLEEKWSGYIGCFASILSFIVSLLLADLCNWHKWRGGGGQSALCRRLAAD